MTYERAIYILKNTAWLGTVNDLAAVEKAIRVLEEAEAEPVRRGWWKRGGIKMSDFVFNCSECNSFSPYGIKTAYCPWCGAKMEE